MTVMSAATTRSILLTTLNRPSTRKDRDSGSLYYTGIHLGEYGGSAIKVYTMRMALQEVEDPVINAI